MDVAEAFTSIGACDFANDFETFNVGNESEHSVSDILQLIAEISGKTIKGYPAPRPYAEGWQTQANGQFI